MKVIFEYNREKDVWCLLNKGKSSINSQFPTKVYEQLTAEYGNNPSQNETATFIENYASKNNINFEQCAKKYLDNWEIIADEYHKRAETIFGVSLPDDVRVYLTVNNRCPYSIQDNMFYVSVSSSSQNETVMHELWHFYTWYGLGADQEIKLGKIKYNDLKEALTVLLNVECKDLMTVGKMDRGYLQHAEMRERITNLWLKERDIHKLWAYISQ